VFCVGVVVVVVDMLGVFVIAAYADYVCAAVVVGVGFGVVTVVVVTVVGIFAGGCVVWCLL